MKKKEQKAAWVHLPSVDRSEPAASITEHSMIEYRNGLMKFCNEEKQKGTVIGTLAYRAALSLDHLARAYGSQPSRIVMSYNVVLKPKRKRDVKRFVAEAKAMMKRTAKFRAQLKNRKPSR